MGIKSPNVLNYNLLVPNVRDQLNFNHGPPYFKVVKGVFGVSCEIVLCEGDGRGSWEITGLSARDALTSCGSSAVASGARMLSCAF